jgi:hypothetical protein
MWLYLIQGIGFGFAASAQPGPILFKGWHETPTFGLAFLFGFYVTFVISLMAIIIVFGTPQKLEPKVNRALVGVSALALTGFGLYQLWLGMMGR